MKNPESILTLIDIEKKLWTNDPEYYRQTLIAEAMLVFGETGVISRSFAIDAIKEEKESGKIWEQVSLDDVRHLWITDDVVLLTYRVAAQWKNDPVTVRSLASSVYVYRDEKWNLAFHQQTEIEKDFIPLEPVSIQ